MSGASRSKQRRTEEPPEMPTRLARVVAEYRNDERVTFGGQGIGSNALKFDGRIFAKLSRLGGFVVKLPEARVAELIAAGQGHRFDPVGGRPMREWLLVDGGRVSWLKLAAEAYAFARANAGARGGRGRRSTRSGEGRLRPTGSHLR